MRIIIENLTGDVRIYGFDIEPSTTGKQLKELLYEKVGDTLKSIRKVTLIFDQDTLDEDKDTLSSYGMEEGSQLILLDLDMQPQSLGNVGLKFIDVSNLTSLKQYNWSQNAPR
ncbi:unnamed protein product [Rotaria magnacalcarata]|uniref:Ubiquitin-like domain-containing protein n=1 Tax=Rotaria magnacalcarata TaxID=392030 RepID=A0A820A8Q4_9BILA|nr:unnamed protein product [Rotaria magnacalcarata]CAF1945665.1 unnamed protein product [Rotaria magnacalcarata]CAF2081926.1 unnamed protein product [Rotaria magnacalcarata]CAF2104281.1 unnamed protein product [Rotaria magnacalcarata]CAF3922690.1 unnamed protein product [Rotaria magnacalcarata]